MKGMAFEQVCASSEKCLNGIDSFAYLLPKTDLFKNILAKYKFYFH